MTQLLYAQEHLECPNHESEKNPIIEEKHMACQDEWELQPNLNKVIFVTSGQMECSSGRSQKYIAAKGQILFLPAKYHFTFQAKEETSLLIIRLQNRIRLCDSFKLEDLQDMD